MGSYNYNWKVSSFIIHPSENILLDDDGSFIFLFGDKLKWIPFCTCQIYLYFWPALVITFELQYLSHAKSPAKLHLLNKENCCYFQET